MRALEPRGTVPVEAMRGGSRMGRRLRFLTCTPPRRAQLLAGLEQLLARYVPSPCSVGDVDVPYHVGRLLQAAGEHVLVLRCFRRSAEATGPHPATAFSVGVSATRLGRADDARAWFARAVELAPGGEHVAAARWLRRLRG